MGVPAAVVGRPAGTSPIPPPGLNSTWTRSPRLVVEHAARRAECRLSRRDRSGLVAPGVGAVFNPATCVFNPSVAAVEALRRTRR